MFEITKDFTFSYSHQLDGLPDGHQCARLHGHNGIVRLHLASDTLDSVGFVQDYGELKPFRQIIDDELDHRHLNDVVDFNPTAELMAKYLYERAHSLGFNYVVAVSWSETPKTWATYRPEGH